jgi:hypothetical protein
VGLAQPFRKLQRLLCLVYPLHQKVALGARLCVLCGFSKYGASSRRRSLKLFVCLIRCRPLLTCAFSLLRRNKVASFLDSGTHQMLLGSRAGTG